MFNYKISQHKACLQQSLGMSQRHEQKLLNLMQKREWETLVPRINVENAVAGG
jgi:hypothetical protein